MLTAEREAQIRTNYGGMKFPSEFAIADLLAEIDRLRAEVERLTAERDALDEARIVAARTIAVLRQKLENSEVAVANAKTAFGEMKDRAGRAEADAERLAEALRDALDYVADETRAGKQGREALRQHEEQK